jgi:SAM-dependent methyltransferase
MVKFDWDKHYANFGQSGDPKDYELSREWKYNLLNKYYVKDKDSIIDVGCGDLQFWKNSPPMNYTGIDISSTIIMKHQNKYLQRQFICSNAANKLDVHADVVICFDVLWHITDDIEYLNILQNIKQYSDKYIYIYTWSENPFTHGIKNSLLVNIARLTGKPCMIADDGGYQKYRNYLSISKDIVYIPLLLAIRLNNPSLAPRSHSIFVLVLSNISVTIFFLCSDASVE